MSSLPSTKNFLTLHNINPYSHAGLLRLLEISAQPYQCLGPHRTRRHSVRNFESGIFCYIRQEIFDIAIVQKRGIAFVASTSSPISEKSQTTDNMPRSLHDFPPLERRLSLEETYSLAHRARRKSTDKNIREDLRLKLAHENVLTSALKDIAVRSPPPSPTQKSVKLERRPTTITWAPSESTRMNTRDDYGFPYEDDGEEDFGGLALSRTVSRKPSR